MNHEEMPMSVFCTLKKFGSLVNVPCAHHVFRMTSILFLVSLFLNSVMAISSGK